MSNILRNISYKIVIGVMFVLIAVVLLQSDSYSKQNKKADSSVRSKVHEVKKPVTVPEGLEMLLDRNRWFKENHEGADGLIPFGARLRALQQLKENLEKGVLGNSPEAIPGNAWSPIGPAPLVSGSYRYSGRVSALAAVSSNTVYAGAATGGLWKTTDGGNTWTALTDEQDSLAMGHIAIDPNNSNIIYAGTGESNMSCDSHYGAGILKSTDAGATWALIGQSYFNETSISKIVVDPSNSNIVWAANTRGTGGFICISKGGTYGIWKSTDAGNTWTLSLGNSQTALTNSYAFDLIMDYTNSQILYAAIRESGIWKTVNGGASWTKLAGGLPTSNIGVIDMAIDPNNSNILYATFESLSTGAHMNNYKTTDGGSTWSVIGKPSSLCSSYCWYCMYIDVAPNGYIFLGGVSLYRSTNGGTSFSSVSTSGIHVDQHSITYPDSSTVWVGNDGGVYKSTSWGSSWTQVNDPLFITQFYPGASLHPTNANFALGGTQDNGSLRWTGTNSWTELYGGDGAFTAIDHSDPNNDYYVSSQYLNIVKTTNGGSSFSSATNGLTDANTTNAPFIAPYVICPNNAAILIAGSNNVWKTTNYASSWSSNSPDPIDPGGQQIRSLAFAPSDTSCNTYLAGLKDGKMYRTTNGGASWTNITGSLPARGINDIAIEPTNANIAYVALSGYGGSHLYKTTNLLGSTPTWFATDTGIPDIPVNAVLIDPTDTNYVYIGSDIGIFRSTNAGSSWQLFMNGHPKVPVHDLVANATTNTIISFTHGRSAFKLTTVQVNIPGEVPQKNGTGTPLTVVKSGSSNLILSWGAPGGNCNPTDYGIYRGNIGSYYSHTKLICSDTNNDLTETISVDSGSYYYILVAHTSTDEGSYGKDKNGDERPAGTEKCIPNQKLDPC